MADDSKSEIDQLIDLVETHDKAKQLALLEYLRKKEIQDVIGKIEKLPDLAHDEFKVFDEMLTKKVTPKALEIRKRRYALFCYYYSHPALTDEQMISFIQLCHHDLSYVQAIRDLNKVKTVMGNMPKARKELYRFQVIELYKLNYQKAEALNDVTGMNYALSGIGKFANLEKEDLEPPWEDYIPPDFEPVCDIKELNPDLIPYSKLDKEKLRKKYQSIEIAEVAE